MPRHAAGHRASRNRLSARGLPLWVVLAPDGGLGLGHGRAFLPSSAGGAAVFPAPLSPHLPSPSPSSTPRLRAVGPAAIAGTISLNQSVTKSRLERAAGPRRGAGSANFMD